MFENIQATVELKQNQLDYLDQMVQKYDLPDRDKALRCLLAFAMSEGKQREEEIFMQIRCLNC
jgi:metal-responsive CopG/Arc/MetJ family transcriptional regulator